MAGKRRVTLYALTICLLLVIAGGLGYLFALKTNLFLPTSETNLAQTNPNRSADLGEPKYQLASLCIDKDCPAEIKVDLKGDGKQETVRVYGDASNYNTGPGTFSNTGCPLLPLFVKVFSGAGLNLSEEFSSKIEEDNVITSLSIVKSFWVDKRDILLLETISTACGSGHLVNLTFIRADNPGGSWYYQLVPGPIFSELDSYKVVQGGSDSKILIARAIWDVNESHFESHKYHLEEYQADLQDNMKFKKTDLGTTKGKYGIPSVDEILKAEPQVIQK